MPELRTSTEISLNLSHLNSTVLRKLEIFARNKAFLTNKYARKVASRREAKAKQALREQAELRESSDPAALDLAQNLSLQFSEGGLIHSENGQNEVEKPIEEEETDDRRSVSNSSFFTSKPIST